MKGGVSPTHLSVSSPPFSANSENPGLSNMNIMQFDGNVSISESESLKTKDALNLPIVATYNVRSLFPKVCNFRTDMLERNISVSFVSEIWQRSDKKEHNLEIEKMLEEDGLKYISTARKANARGISYGGAALIVDLEKYSCEKLNISVPQNIEAVWGLLKPRAGSAQFKKIIACSFYSPPNKRSNSKMADHLVTTLHMLNAKYPDSGIILGADKNKMDIRPLLNCGLKLRQVVDKNTRQNSILSIIIMNTFKYYKISADADGGPRSRVRTAGHSAQPPIDVSGNFSAHVSAE